MKAQIISSDIVLLLLWGAFNHPQSKRATQELDDTHYTARIEQNVAAIVYERSHILVPQLVEWIAFKGSNPA
jgi:hypothetical protein